MIGIYAPYDLTDTTTMAIGLAEYATALGYCVSYFCPTTRHVDIHPGWDRKVKIETDILFNDWRKQCDHIAWFHMEQARFAHALARHSRNTLVVTRSTASPEYVWINRYFDSVLVPSIAVYEHLSQRWQTKDLHPVPWSLQQPLTNKPERTQELVDIYVPMTGSIMRNLSRQLLCAIGITLKRYKHVRFTLAHYSRPERSVKEIIHSMQREFPGRLSLTSVPIHNQRAAMYRNYDWTLYVPYQDDVYVPALESLSVGTPVIGLTTPPGNECILHEYSGYGIQSKTVKDTLWEMPIISQPEVSQLVSALSNVLEEPELLDSISANSWAFMNIRKHTFNSVWKTIWEEPR